MRFLHQGHPRRSGHRLGIRAQRKADERRMIQEQLSVADWSAPVALTAAFG